jgi:hypothetical protein
LNSKSLANVTASYSYPKSNFIRVNVLDFRVDFMTKFATKNLLIFKSNFLNSTTIITNPVNIVYPMIITREISFISKMYFFHPKSQKGKIHLFLTIFVINQFLISYLIFIQFYLIIFINYN